MSSSYLYWKPEQPPLSTITRRNSLPLQVSCSCLAHASLILIDFVDWTFADDLSVLVLDAAVRIVAVIDWQRCGSVLLTDRDENEFEVKRSD